MKILDDGVAKLLPATVVIQILDPKNELSAGLSGTFLGPPKRDRMPDDEENQSAMERCGRGREFHDFRLQISGLA